MYEKTQELRMKIFSKQVLLCSDLAVIFLKLQIALDDAIFDGDINSNKGFPIEVQLSDAEKLIQTRFLVSENMNNQEELKEIATKAIHNTYRTIADQQTMI